MKVGKEREGMGESTLNKEESELSELQVGRWKNVSDKPPHLTGKRSVFDKLKG